MIKKGQDKLKIKKAKPNGLKNKKADQKLQLKKKGRTTFSILAPPP